MKRILALVVVVLSGWFGNPLEMLDYWRFWLAVATGVVAVGAGYWYMLPEILPLWPAVVAMCVPVAAGVVWQRWAEIQ